MTAEWNANVAGDHAHVGFQIGVMHVGANVYQVNEGATADEKFRVAVHYLQGGSPAEARRRIEAVALEDGLSSAEVAYHWALSVLSGRSLANLGSDDLAVLDRAFEMAYRHASGRWWLGVSVLRLLVDALFAVGPDGQPDHRRLATALTQFDLLPEVDRRDIEHHLRLILSGAAQDHIEAVNAEHVRVARMAGDRTVRVPKFFEPDPQSPVAKVARAAPAERIWGSLVGGGLLAVTGLLVLLATLAEANPAIAVLDFVLLAGGGYAVVRHGVERAFRRSRRAAKEAEFTTGVRAEFTRPPGDQLSRNFPEAVTAMVDAAFTDRQPSDPQWRDAFRRDTGGLRTALHSDLVDLYGYQGVRPAALRWLVHHHADDIARRWQAGTLDDFRREQPPGTIQPAFFGGIAALAAAVVLAAVVMNAAVFCAAVFAVPMLVVGARFAQRGGIMLYGERRRMALDAAEFAQRWEAEKAAYDNWVAWLADRPTDVEMGTWLDLDLASFKRDVMHEYRLSNRDIFAHLALTEAAPGSLRARDVGGPFRHSAYTVLLFLLTEGGVRQVKVRLDFARGVFTAEQRTTFRYDAIGSVRVSEVGVRYDDGQRRVLSEEQAYAAPQKIVTHQAFTLTLVNGQHIRVLLDSFQGELLDQRRETAEHLADLALDAAGVTSALRILEAIAADGRDWIMLERQRLHRRIPAARQMPSRVEVAELPLGGTTWPG